VSEGPTQDKESTEAARKRILIVEDDEAIASGVALNLKLQGFSPATVQDGDDALEQLQTDPPDLVLLDISLPKKNGLEVLAEIRQAGNTTPVIVLSARQSEYDKVAALRLGADDYVTKPFSVAELLARIEAVLRRIDQAARAEATQPAAAEAQTQAQPKPRVLQFSDVEVNLDTRQVTRAGEAVSLTHLEFELLSFLLQHETRVFDRQQLLQRVWGVNHSGSPRTVDNFVGQLRSKLEEHPNQPRHLVTVRGSGYRFDR
jgi:DNA-binding response OmpR family regulator